MTYNKSRLLKTLTSAILIFAMVVGISTTVNSKVKAACVPQNSAQNEISSSDFFAWIKTSILRFDKGMFSGPPPVNIGGPSEPKPHTHNYTRNIVRYPSCTQTGTAYYSCKGCGHSYHETIPATGHKMYSIYRNGHTEWYCSICNARFS